MSVVFYLLGFGLLLGGVGLGVFLWALKSGQYEDLDGAARRILYDDDPPPT
jgi:cbb3-type cytochrome oxidase maturation protein